jgi:hypothetical protein
MKKVALITLVICLVLSSVSSAGVLFQRWDVATSSIADAVAVVNGTMAPNDVNILPEPIYENIGDNYVGSLTASLKVPADGSYQFYVSSDDDSELLVDGAVVASVSGWTGAQEWTKMPSQASAPIALKAGQIVSIEGIHREGSGGDNLCIGWLTPDSNAIVLLPDSVTYPSADNWANTPMPASATTDLVDGMLSWQAPASVENPTYTVSFGTDPNALAVVAQGLTDPVYDAGMLGTTLDFSTTYYWKVAVDGSDGSAFVWSFTTAPPVIVNSISGDAELVGAAAQLSVDANSPLGSDLTYQWHRLNFEPVPGVVLPDVEIPGATSAVYQVPEISATDQGYYYVLITSPEGQVSSPTVFLDAQVGLIHRWSFNDSTDGVTLPDSVGGEDATLVNNTGQATIADGQVTLGNDGSQVSGDANGMTAGDYIDLPNGLISPLTQMTVEVWATWNDDTQGWARVFSFGTNNAGEDVARAGDAGGDVYVMFFTSKRGWDENGALTYQHGGTAPAVAPGGKLPLGQEILITAVQDDKSSQVRLYINGVAVGGEAALFAMKMMTDNNNWLGRSEWGGDPMFEGSFDEVRLYDTALSGEQIAADYLAGPDALGQLPAKSTAPAMIGDLNGDGVYDFLDVAIAADKWLTQKLDGDATIAKLQAQ